MVCTNLTPCRAAFLREAYQQYPWMRQSETFRGYVRSWFCEAKNAKHVLPWMKKHRADTGLGELSKGFGTSVQLGPDDQALLRGIKQWQSSLCAREVFALDDKGLHAIAMTTVKAPQVLKTFRKCVTRISGNCMEKTGLRLFVVGQENRSVEVGQTFGVRAQWCGSQHDLTPAKVISGIAVQGARCQGPLLKDGASVSGQATILCTRISAERVTLSLNVTQSDQGHSASTYLPAVCDDPRINQPCGFDPCVKRQWKCVEKATGKLSIECVREGARPTGFACGERKICSPRGRCVGARVAQVHLVENWYRNASHTKVKCTEELTPKRSEYRPFPKDVELRGPRGWPFTGVVTSRCLQDAKGSCGFNLVGGLEGARISKWEERGPQKVRFWRLWGSRAILVRLCAQFARLGSKKASRKTSLGTLREFSELRVTLKVGRQGVLLVKGPDFQERVPVGNSTRRVGLVRVVALKGKAVYTYRVRFGPLR